MRKLVGLAALVLVWTAGVGVRGQSEPLQVMATTSVLADVVAHVAGEWAAVDSLLPPDTDAHVYEPTADDALRLSQSDLLFVIGAGYESFVAGLLANAGADVPVVEVNQGVAILPLGVTGTGAAPEPLGVLGSTLECGIHETDEPEATEEAIGVEHADCDPHTWLSPLNVIVWTQNIAGALAAADPDHADAYYENAAVYADELQALDGELSALVEGVPAEARRLLTNHENLQYFAARYGFALVATVLPGGSSDAELDPQALAALITLVQAESVPVVFAEVTANTALADTLAHDAGVRVVSDLYIEALSEAGGPAAAYLDLMRYNAGVIVDALTQP